MTFTKDGKEELMLWGNVLHVELNRGVKGLQNLIFVKQKKYKSTDFSKEIGRTATKC